ncbi:hypothetical protein ZIOFF_031709 [Zingiber officinale]|uniref:Uncharacterized protein n=1 Tax=Zingiber officinale TaxID=94328 RepID=A0A8J5GI22_ZINOF|nr:hypothetical protein ZIOFF_031709 [Zingiber officinale]
MAAEEVGNKFVRLLYFVGAGLICTKGINLWRDYERKAAAVTTEETIRTMPEAPEGMVNASTAVASKP